MKNIHIGETLRSNGDKRNQFLPYISHALDDALNVRQVSDMPDNARLVVYQCGFEPVVVAVWSYLGLKLDEDEAEDIAQDYLTEINWFSGEDKTADLVL